MPDKHKSLQTRNTSKDIQIPGIQIPNILFKALTRLPR
jgi:hypothetical protein